MTVDLWVLMATCALLLFLASVPLFAVMRRAYGLPAMLGNREGLQPLTGWGGRVVRAYDNLRDNLILFAAVVLTVHHVGADNDQTAVSAIVFFCSRLVHASSYIAGIPVIRTVAYLFGVGATIAMAAHLF